MATTYPKLPAPRKRPRGHGCVTRQRGRYVAEYQDLVSGKNRRKACSSEAEAHLFLDEWYAAKTRRRFEATEQAAARKPRLREYTAPAPGSFAELCEAWRKAKMGTVRATSWRNYDGALAGLTHYLGAEMTDALDEDRFAAYRRARLAGKDWVGAAGLQTHQGNDHQPASGPRERHLRVGPRLQAAAGRSQSSRAPG